MINCSFYGLTNSRSDCAATWGKYLSLFCDLHSQMPLVSLPCTSEHHHNMTQPDLDKHAFKFLCNFRPPPSFYSLAVTFTHLSVRHTPCFTLPGLVVFFVFFKISSCFTWIKFPRFLSYALFVHFSSLPLSVTFFLSYSLLWQLRPPGSVLWPQPRWYRLLLLLLPVLPRPPPLPLLPLPPPPAPHFAQWDNPVFFSVHTR